MLNNFRKFSFPSIEKRKNNWCLVMLNNFRKFSFPSIEKRWTKDKDTDGKKEKKKNRKNEK